MECQELNDFRFTAGFYDAPPGMEPPGALAAGSRNVLALGQSYKKAFMGLTSLGTGSRVLFQVKNGYAGLSDVAGPVNGAGSVFSYIANTIFYIGAGQVQLNGTNISGATASSTLKMVLSRSGSYTAGTSGPYAAGLNQPSSPIVASPATLGAGLTGKLNGVYSFKIAALRSTTGARSIASATSAVLTIVNGTAQITFPAAQSGADYWVIFSTFRGFGGTGVHYRTPINGALQISEATVNGLSGRTLEFEFEDGDLTTEAAWIDDYPPPAGTHAFAIGAIVGVGGCYSDATDAPSSTSPGTCVAISLNNFPESFKPSNLLYLPEQIVSLLGRPTDSYIYVGCRNSVHMIQYTGATVGPACVLTTLWPDVGIANAHGWCQVYGILFAALSRGGFATIGPLGRPDTTFSEPVRESTKNWDPASTVVDWNPDTQQVTFSNANIGYAYSLQSGEWSGPIYYSDFATGNVLSAVQTANQLKICLNNAGTHTLYTWNAGSGSIAAFISGWAQAPKRGRTKTIYEILEDVQADQTTVPHYVSIHRNHQRTYATDGSMVSGANGLFSVTAGWLSARDVGKYVLVFGAGAAGGLLLGKIASVSASTAFLVDPSTGATLNASTSVTNAYVLIAKYIFPRTDTAGFELFRPKRIRVREAWSYAVGMVVKSTTGDAQALGACVYGTVDNISAGKST